MRVLNETVETKRFLNGFNENSIPSLRNLLTNAVVKLTNFLL